MDVERVRPFRILDRLEQIDVPTAIIWGRQDPRSKVDNAIAAAGRIPRCRLSIIEDCGHLPYLEQPQQFNDFVASFMNAAL